MHHFRFFLSWTGLASSYHSILYTQREQVTGVRAISPSKRQRVQEASAAVTRVGGLTDVEERQVVASMAPTARVVTGTESAGTGGYWRPQILVYLSASNEARVGRIGDVESRCQQWMTRLPHILSSGSIA